LGFVSFSQTFQASGDKFSLGPHQQQVLNKDEKGTLHCLVEILAYVSHTIDALKQNSTQNKHLSTINACGEFCESTLKQYTPGFQPIIKDFITKCQCLTVEVQSIAPFQKTTSEVTYATFY